jgi:hypothetical protein
MAGEVLPEASVDCHRGDLPLGAGDKPAGHGLKIGETIHRIRDTNSWVVLKNIEQVPAYAALLAELLGELAPEIVDKTGRLLTSQGFIYVSSPGAVTPYHLDCEHNILLQLLGKKAMAVFPGGRAVFHRSRRGNLRRRLGPHAGMAQRAGRPRHHLRRRAGGGDLRPRNGSAPRQERARTVGLAVDHLAQRVELGRG